MDSAKTSSSKLKKLGLNSEVWNKLSFDQRVNLVILIALFFALPLGVIFAVTPRIPFFSRAATLTGSNPPHIRTRSLPIATLGVSYNAIMEGYDDDAYDKLEMEIGNLPSGLEQANCTTGSSRRGALIVCRIRGIPQEAGAFKVHILLTDSEEGRDVETLELSVSNTKALPSPTPNTSSDSDLLPSL